MKGKTTEFDETLFEAKLGDLFRRAERYEPCFGTFFSPKERFFAERYARTRGADVVWFFYGGFDGCERARFFVLPEYMAPGEGELSAARVRELFPELAGDAVTSLLIEGSGYRTLDHRDYLGSLLGLGIERDMLGDIAVRDEHSAILFCDTKIAAFLENELHKVATDTVHVKPIDCGDDFLPKQEFQSISDTVASARLDCIVSALAGVSRERAQGLVRGGLVEVNYLTEDENDTIVPEDAVIGIRGFGKYILRSVGEQTKKGRYRLRADKYK